MWMNECDVADLVRMTNQYPTTPNAWTVAMTLDRLVIWTNRNSDGWPYWSKPSNAAKRLQEIASRVMREYRSGFTPEVSDVELKAALTPVKAFLTRQGVDHAEVLV